MHAYPFVELYEPHSTQMDHQIVDLTVLCMQQNGAAISTGIINRVIASFENRWSADDGPTCRRSNDLQGDFSVR